VVGDASAAGGVRQTNSVDQNNYSDHTLVTVTRK
jgi:hypothetical protein